MAFRIKSIHTTGYEAELFTGLTRMQALDHVEQRGEHGCSIVEGFLGVQLTQAAVHQYRSTDGRYIVRIEPLDK